MDPSQNTPPQSRRRDYDTFGLNTTPIQHPTMESPQGGFVNFLQRESPIPQQALFQHQTLPFNTYQAPPQQPLFQHQPPPLYQTAFFYQQPPQVQQPPQRIQPEPAPEFVPDSPEFIPETQPEPAKKATKGRKKGKAKVTEPTEDNEGKKVTGAWTNEEELALTRAWIACSENKEEGNSMPKNDFWKKIKTHFDAQVGKGRRKDDQLSGKWRDIRLKVGEFCGIYHNLERLHRSGSNDFDVYTAALEQYKKTTATRKVFGQNIVGINLVNLVFKLFRNLGF